MRNWVVLILTLLLSFSTSITSSKSSSIQPILLTPDLDALCLVLPTEPINYSQLNISAYSGSLSLSMDNIPNSNFITDAGATLGRVLFYDKKLSINDKVSCSSCHIQRLGFTDDARFSRGFDGIEFTSAHSMRLGNARYYEPASYFWDRSAITLGDQVIVPIQNKIEMGFTSELGGMDSLISKLAEIEYYNTLFINAFGDQIINTVRIQESLAQFIRSLVATNTKFDLGLSMVFDSAQGDNGMSLDFPNYTQQENLGKELFMKKEENGGAGCMRCHLPPSFGLDKNSKSTGLDASENIEFKSPSLINVAVTGPYMHDGRFNTLEEVILHYAQGIELSPSLDPILIQPNGEPERLRINSDKRDQLIAFLNTLTDIDLLTHERWSSPFYECESECENLIGTFETIDSKQVLYQTKKVIKSHEILVNESKVIYKSLEIELKEGFKVDLGSTVTLEIEPCNN